MIKPQYICILILGLIFNMPTMAQRTVEIIVPYSQGGTADRISQSLIPHLRHHMKPHGLTPVLSYKPGAGSMLGSSVVARADKDNLTLLIVGNSLVTAQLTTERWDLYDVDNDFKIVYYLGHIPMLMVVHDSSPIRNLQDFKSVCQKTTLTYGSAGIGSATHLSALILSKMLECRSLHVPYKGVGSAITDLHGRHIDFIVDFVTSISPHISANKFRPILAVSNNRNQDYPTLPSIPEISNQPYTFYNWFVLATNSSLNAHDQEIMSIVQLNLSKDLAWHETLRGLGLENSRAHVPANFLSAEKSMLAPIVKQAIADAK